MNEPRRPSPTKPAVVRWAAAWRAWPAAAVGVAAFALGLARLRVESADLPAGGAWIDHLAGALVSWREGVFGTDWLAAGPESLWTRLLDAALLQANQQWDPAVWGLAAVVLHALASALVVAVLARRQTPAIGLVLAGVSAAILCAQAVSPAPRGAVPTGEFLLLLAALQAATGWGTAALSWRWWLAWLLGVGAVLAAPAGAAVALCFAAHEAVQLRRRGRVPDALRQRAWAAIALSVAVTGFGLARLAAAGAGGSSEMRGAWTEFWFGGVDAAHAFAVAAGLLLMRESLSCGRRGWRARFLVGGLVTVVAAGAALDRWVDAARTRASAPPSRRLEAVRDFVRSGNPDTLAAAAVSGPDAALRLGDPRVRALLPPSLRPPLALRPAEPGGPGGFEPGAVPRPGLDEAPAGARGTFGRDPSAGEAIFVSAPVATKFPVVSLLVSGELAPPDTALFLRAADGTVVEPMQSIVRSPDRWRRVNFAVPDGPFSVCARAGAGGPWLAFSDPVEVGVLSRHATKALGGLPAAAGFLAIVLAAVAAVAARRGGGTLAGAVDRDATAWAMRVLPWLALCGYAVFLAHHLDLSAGGSDSSGYRNSARLLGEGVFVADLPRPPGLGSLDLPMDAFVPPGFRLAGADAMVPTYPVGVPLMYAVAGWIMPGDAGVAAVVLAHLLGGVLATFGLARAVGLERGWAWLAAMIIGLCPVYYFMGVQAMSDGPAMVWATIAVWAAWASREHAWVAVVAGFATAVAVLVRPSNVLISVPVVVLLGADPRRLGCWLLGGLPGGLWQAGYSWTLYGDPFTTGYGSIWWMFDRKLLGVTLESYAVWWTALLTPSIWLMCGFPFLRSVPGRLRLALGLWALAYAGFYVTYLCTYETWWYQRFVMPAFPGMVIMALYVARAAGRRWCFAPGESRGHGWVAAVACVAVAGLLLGTSLRLRTLYFVGPGNHYETSSRWLARHVEPDALVIAGQTSGAVYFYARRGFLRWDAVDLATVRRAVDLSSTAGRPVYASLFTAEAAALQIEADAWEVMARFGDIAVWRRGPGTMPPAVDDGVGGR